MLQDLNEISDGKVYGIKDMVRAACSDCAGCHACCEAMGNSIVLDPYDVWRLQEGTGKKFEELIQGPIELGVEEGLILPHLSMSGKGESCFFLNEEGRCSIHPYRPGLCRVFPLGRIYEEKQIRYFLQKDACRKPGRTKVKVEKWLDTPQQRKNEKFLLEWHAFRKKMEEKIKQQTDGQAGKTLNLFLLKQFYITLYKEDGEFYEQFAKHLEEAEQMEL